MFYIKSPFRPAPKLLVQGSPEFLFGSWNADVGPTLGTVISDSGNGATSTVVFQILSGNIPFVDALVSIVGTASAAGAYNVTNAGVLSVNTTVSGVCTITFSGTGNSVSASDYGQVYITQPEIGDQLTSGLISSGVASAPVCSAVAGPDNTGKSLSVTVKLPANTTANPSTLSSLNVFLQGANFDYDTEFNDVAEVVTGGSAGNTYDWQSGQGVPTAPSNALGSGNVLQPNFKFYRLRVATGGSGTGPIIGKLVS